MQYKNLKERIQNQKQSSRDVLRKRNYEEYGIFDNPFPSGGQTSGNPRMRTEADDRIDTEIEQFYRDKDRKSHVRIITATQGIGKTNLLNNYERELKETFEPIGFFIIRYMPDPEPSFDPLIRSIFDAFGENHLKQLANTLAEQKKEDFESHIKDLRTEDMKRMLRSLYQVAESGKYEIDDVVKYVRDWLLGFPVRKSHREILNITFRLDTVESKTRALRDLVIFSRSIGKLEGIFLLLDELEKQGDTVSLNMAMRYLSALRALIDALPQNLFLIAAITPDALSRYREMLPALRGRLANEVQLKPLQNPIEAIELYQFYNNKAMESARESARQDRMAKNWEAGNIAIISEDTVRAIFQQLLKISTIDGVRQRDFLNGLNKRTQEKLDNI